MVTCFWLWSFVQELASELQHLPGLMEMTVELLKISIKEKVVRVVLALYRNFVHLARQDAVTTFIGHKLPQVIEQSLKQRTFTDDDVKEDLQWLSHQLEQIIQQLTTWDEYLSEVKSGKLEWSPPHVNESFWKRHAAKLTDQQGELVKLLTDILHNALDPLSLTVACHDVTQLLKYEPQAAKRLLNEAGAKIRIMELMTHPHPEVRYQALTATQAYMSQL